jgi:hypothetical protein
MIDLDTAAPPAALRDNVVRSLRQRGLLARTRLPIALRTMLAAAAGMLLFASGAAFGRKTVTPPTDSRPSFVLLLYEDSAFRARGTATVAEYLAWSDSLRRVGVYITGEKLNDQAAVLARAGDGETGASPALGSIAGLFIVRADDLEDALVLARTCPHIRHGGSVVVRPIETT